MNAKSNSMPKLLFPGARDSYREVSGKFDLRHTCMSRAKGASEFEDVLRLNIMFGVPYELVYFSHMSCVGVIIHYPTAPFFPFPISSFSPFPPFDLGLIPCPNLLPMIS